MIVKANTAGPTTLSQAFENRAAVVVSTVEDRYEAALPPAASTVGVIGSAAPTGTRYVWPTKRCR